MRNDKEHLLNILELIEKIQSGFFFEKFNRDEIYRFGIAKLIECIGEEVKKLSSDFKAKHDHIPWRSIIGMRNFIVHEYADIEWDVVLETIEVKIPILKDFIDGNLDNDHQN